jgi:hypothetical protein
LAFFADALATLHFFSKNQADLFCCVCLDPLEDNAVFHKGDGEKHPLHFRCLQIWLKTAFSCPACRVDLNIQSLFTWKRRVVNQIRFFYNEVKKISRPSAWASCLGVLPIVFLDPNFIEHLDFLKMRLTKLIAST